MKKISLFTIFIVLIFFIFRGNSNSKNKWKESIGTINSVVELSENIYGCELSYNIDINNKKDVIKQYYMDLKQEPINNQKLKLKYNKDEPIIFVLEDEIKYVK